MMMKIGLICRRLEIDTGKFLNANKIFVQNAKESSRSSKLFSKTVIVVQFKFYLLLILLIIPYTVQKTYFTSFQKKFIINNLYIDTFSCRPHLLHRD